MMHEFSINAHLVSFYHLQEKTPEYWAFSLLLLHEVGKVARLLGRDGWGGRGFKF